jgi:hypothetical protein
MKTIKRVPIDSRLERTITLATLTSPEFCRSASRFLRPELLEPAEVSLVVSWAMEAWARRQEPLGDGVLARLDIESGRVNPGTVERCRTLVESLAGLEAPVIPHLLDQAEALIRQNAVLETTRNARELAQSGQVAEAELALANHRKIMSNVDTGIDPFNNMEELRKAFDQTFDPLVMFPGRIGSFLNPDLVREGFVSFEGPPKRGKSWWLQEVAYRARRAGRNVVYFELGDLGRGMTMLRLLGRLAGRAVFPDVPERFPHPVLDCSLNQQGKCVKSECKGSNRDLARPLDSDDDWSAVAFESGTFHRPCNQCRRERGFRGSVWYEWRDRGELLTWRDAWHELERSRHIFQGAGFRLVNHPNRTATCSMLDTQLSLIEDEAGFSPDVVVIDYADIMAPDNPRLEKRHQENDRWMWLRSLAQKRRCLVVIGSQGDADSSSQRSMRYGNFSENHLKRAQVTVTFGINRTDAEKRAGLWRINRIVRRTGSWDVSEEVTVLGCCDICRPVLDSF